MSSEESTPKTINWAILGTGSIATDMVQILKQLPNTEVLAIGSRTIESANKFADRWSVSRRYASYEEAASDADVHVVYIATPSLRHPTDCKMALGHGKAVLCEKSMAPSYDVGKEVIQMAMDKKLLFVHAVWSRFFPAMDKLRSLIEEGAVGDVKSARVSFCQNDGAGSCSALLETGIYCAQFLQWVLRPLSSEKEQEAAKKGVVVRGACRTVHPETKHDTHVSALLEFPFGRTGTFECSLAHASERSAVVYGTGGIIEIPFPFWCPTKLVVTKMSGQASQTWEEPVVYDFDLPEGVKALPISKPTKEGDVDGVVPGFHFVNSEGLTYEAAEVNRCVREGLTESPSFTSEECLDILRIISDIDAMSRANE